MSDTPDIPTLRRLLADVDSPLPWVAVEGSGIDTTWWGQVRASSGCVVAEVDCMGDAPLIAALVNAADALLAEIEQLRGITPEFPPRPPNGEGLPRYGLRWTSPTEPLAVPMDDGYWTPWHLAKDALLTAYEAGRARINTLEDEVSGYEIMHGHTIHEPQMDVFVRAVEAAAHHKARADAAEAKLAAAEAREAGLIDGIRHAHTEGLRWGLGPCVCDVCKKPTPTKEPKP